METPSRTTELEAVNTILSLMGEAPVNSLVPPYTQDTANARRMLLEASKSVQAEGWKFNSEEDYTLSQDADGEIQLPSNALSVDCDQETAFDLVVRGNRLYDLKDHTFTIGQNVKAEMVWMFPFDELPECARQYILIVAARRNQHRFVGSGEQHQYSAVDEGRARAVLMNEQAQTADANILNDPTMAYISRRWMHRRFR
jgi:hypothetical protein